jgi:hypothetical protein
MHGSRAGLSWVEEGMGCRAWGWKKMGYMAERRRRWGAGLWREEEMRYRA